MSAFSVLTSLIWMTNAINVITRNKVIRDKRGLRMRFKINRKGLRDFNLNLWNLILIMDFAIFFRNFLFFYVYI